MAVEIIIKQPAEQMLVRLFDASGVVSAVVASATARGLVAGSAPIGAAVLVSGGGVNVTLSAGTDGERYLISVRATKTDGTIAEAELDVAVIDGAWAMPDGGVAYLTIAEFVDNFGLEETVRMTDRDGSGRIDRAMLIAALRAAQGIANANLAARYAVPIATVPDSVKTAIADIARARLYPRGAPEGVATAAKEAVRLLERVASGALPLPLPAGTSADPATTDAPVLISPGRRAYPGGRDSSW